MPQALKKTQQPTRQQTRNIVKHGQLDIRLESVFTPANDEELVNVTKALGGADLPDGYIAGWASTSDVDSYQHVVAKGAFTQAIQTRGLYGPRGIKLLIGHDWDKVAGVIKVLETRQGRLWIEAQLNLNISFARDAYEGMKMSGGWNFSVGFMLQDYEWKESPDGREVLYINRGDLYEVSAVPFPGNEECTMDFVKSRLSMLQPSTVAEFEKSLIARGLVTKRDMAHEITLAVKSCVHLFLKAPDDAPAAEPEPQIDPPVLEEAQIKSLREKMESLSKLFDS